jgi:hypothetical protein
MIMSESEFNKFYNQYLADQQDGFVSNLNQYVRSRYEKEINEIISKIMFRQSENIKFKTK